MCTVVTTIVCAKEFWERRLEVNYLNYHNKYIH